MSGPPAEPDRVETRTRRIRSRDVRRGDLQPQILVVDLSDPSAKVEWIFPSSREYHSPVERSPLVGRSYTEGSGGEDTRISGEGVYLAPSDVYKHLWKSRVTERRARRLHLVSDDTDKAF